MKKPPNFQWIGYNADQIELLDFIDFIGNNGWSRNSQTDEIMTSTLDDCNEAGLTIEQVKDAMRSIGYSDHSIGMLDRWERKRTTGRFDPPRPGRRPTARYTPPRDDGPATTLRW